MFKRSVSLAHQVKQQIRSQIEQDAYAGSQGQLPSEPQLSADLGVSRATVREALTMLAREGIIVRRHGIGTFVNSNLPGLKTSSIENIEFEDMITQQGYRARVRVLRVGLEPAGKAASHFEAAEDEPFFTVNKVFLANDIPVIFCHNAVPLSLVLPDCRPGLDDRGTGRQPIYRFLQECCHQDVSYQVSHIDAAPADASLATHLDCPEGYPLLSIEEIGFNEAQRAVFYCLNYYRSDIIRFDTIRKVVRPFSWEQDG